MGVKAIRDRYRIKHIVQFVKDYDKYGGDVICIGSGYVHDLIVIGADGKIKQSGRGYKDEDLVRYMQELQADEKSGVLVNLFHSKDEFGPLTPVFTHDAGRVIRKYCEEFGWPNTTTDGLIMYENTHFLNRSDAVKRMMTDTRLGVKYAAESICEATKELFPRILRHSKRLTRNVWHYLLARVPLHIHWHGKPVTRGYAGNILMECRCGSRRLKEL